MKFRNGHKKRTNGDVWMEYRGSLAFPSFNLKVGEKSESGNKWLTFAFMASEIYNTPTIHSNATCNVCAVRNEANPSHLSVSSHCKCEIWCTGVHRMLQWKWRWTRQQPIRDSSGCCLVFLHLLSNILHVPKLVDVKSSLEQNKSELQWQCQMSWGKFLHAVKSNLAPAAAVEITQSHHWLPLWRLLLVEAAVSAGITDSSKYFLNSRLPWEEGRRFPPRR